MTLEDFERSVMTALLGGDDPLLETLRQQYAAASVRSREVLPHGFITRFEVPASAPTVARKSMHLDDLQVEIEGASTPVDASLNVHNGRLHSLECTLYEGSFPEAPSITAAWYYGSKKFPAITPELIVERDLEELLEEE